MIVDGYDELDPQSQEQVVDWFRAILQAYPKTHLVTTGKIDQLDGLIGLGFNPLAVIGWDPRTASRFIQQSPSPDGDGGRINRPFDDFWKLYPKKVGNDAARKAWDRRKINTVLAEQIMAALRVQIESPGWRREGGRFIPHPATWLNQGRWQDEASEAEHRMRLAI